MIFEFHASSYVTNSFVFILMIFISDLTGNYLQVMGKYQKKKRNRKGNRIEHEKVRMKKNKHIIRMKERIYVFRGKDLIGMLAGL